MFAKSFAPAVIGAMILISLMLYPFLPEQLPIHWNLEGNLDAMAHKAAAVILMPVITIFVLLLMRAKSTMAAFYSHDGSSEKTYVFFVNSAVLFMGFMHVLMLLIALNPVLSMVRAVVIGVGGLLAVLGNIIGRVRPNPVVGFRFPWTLADDEVWRRTHRMGARWMFVSGIVTMVMALVLPPELLFVELMTLLLGGSIAIMVYSYCLYRQRQKALS